MLETVKSIITYGLKDTTLLLSLLSTANPTCSLFLFYLLLTKQFWFQYVVIIYYRTIYTVVIFSCGCVNIIFATFYFSKLINKSVRGTVDLRALSKVQGSALQRKEAIEDNMTLVVESGRAIGCQVTEETAEKIIQKDPSTITDFLVNLIRVNYYHTV